MKKLKILITSVLLSVFILALFASCNFMTSLNTYIYIYDCEHGRIEVEYIESDGNRKKYKIIPYADELYYLHQKNLYVIENSDSDSSNYFYYNNDSYINFWTYNDDYAFYADKNAKITISAIFTKVE